MQFAGCDVYNLKMRDYDFEPEESRALAINARETMGGLFLANSCEISIKESGLRMGGKIMNVMSVIKERRSIRKYMDTLVEDEKLQNILEVARLAPSADNNQGWKFVVIKDNETRKKLVETTGQTWVASAPIIIVCCGTSPTIVMPNGQPKYTIDLSVATSFMMLEAVNQGLGTCWLGGYDESAVREILGIPDEVRVVSMLSLGYPDEAPTPRPRKELNKIVSYEKY